MICMQVSSKEKDSAVVPNPFWLWLGSVHITRLYVVIGRIYDLADVLSDISIIYAVSLPL